MNMKSKMASIPVRIMPIGDSMTRGSYLVHYETGLFVGQPIGLPNPAGGGWRKALQDKLRAAGVAFDFVGALDYMAYGKDGVCDKDFDPQHRGHVGRVDRRGSDAGRRPPKQAWHGEDGGSLV